MIDDRFRMTQDEFLAGARVPVEEQVEVQAEPVPSPVGWRGDPVSWAGGGSGDADGD